MDDLTAKIKDVAAKLTGDDSDEERRSRETSDSDFRTGDREFGADRAGTRDDYGSTGTRPGAGSEPYPPVAPDMTGSERGEYSGTSPRGDGDGIDDEETAPPV